MNVQWKNRKNQTTQLYFDDLDVRQSFRNISHRSQGAVYTKVVDPSGNEWMYEIETGRLWVPTESPVEVVNVNCEVDAFKPNLY